MSNARAVILSLQVLLAAGCSSGHPGNLGQAGSGGGGGAGGTDAGGPGGTETGGAGGNGIGTGGTGSGGIAGVGSGGIAGASVGGAGALPLCTQPALGGAAGSGAAGADGGATPAAAVESCAYDAAQNPVLTPVSAAVTVTSVDQVPDGNCSFIYSPFTVRSSAPSLKVVVESADQQSWTVYVRIPGLPADTIRAGDGFDLAIAAQSAFFQGPEQAITLARNGKLVIFGYAGFQLPSLATFGVMLTDAGRTCSVDRCAFEHHAVHAVNGTAAAEIGEGETRQVGDLAFSVSQDIQWISGGGQACDAANHALMGGFTVFPREAGEADDGAADNR